MEMSTNGGANTLVADKLLLATGRVSNADRLRVKNSGVEVDGRGFVSTNEYLETNVPGVWALGDIVGRYLLKHSANLEAAYVGHLRLFRLGLRRIHLGPGRIREDPR